MKTTPTLLLLTFILGACSASVSTPQPVPAQPPTATVLPPASQPAPAACAYQWATQELPELSAQLNTTIQSIIPGAASRAAAYGENCLDTEAQTIRFLPLETDFYITISVETLDDYPTFGDWLYEVMLIIDGIPAEDLAGSQPGFVEFRFEKSEFESLTFRVPVQGFFDAAANQNGEELFRQFSPPP